MYTFDLWHGKKILRDIFIHFKSQSMPKIILTDRSDNDDESLAIQSDETDKSDVLC